VKGIDLLGRERFDEAAHRYERGRGLSGS
jgi:hypothetical protein